MKKQSIRRQFAVTTIVLIAAIVLICLMVNVLFLEQFYVSNKKDNLIETYQLLNSNTSWEQISEQFIINLEVKCNRYNLNPIVISPLGTSILSSTIASDALQSKLIQYRFGFTPTREVVEETARYVIHVTMDSRTKSSNMEMWGQLDNGYFFLLTTPIESIEESATISNRFLAAIGMIAVMIGGIIAWIYSGKIAEPILKLASLSERITKLDFEARYIGKEKNEIGILGHNMNSLADSLQETISELKSANIELQKDIQRKDELDKQRQEFIGNVSHELKTPIALIQGYAEGLREGITEDPESMHYYLEVISDEAERMNRMVKSLMTLSELESGSQPITMERFDLVALVRNYISSADILIKEQGVKLSIVSPASLYVWGDEFKIEEVLMNYFSNAVHHLDGEPKQIVVSIEQLENKARVGVFNTGKHIPEEDKERIWEKFYKIDKARTRAYGGSGVGLSIVKAIMNSIQQECGVENADGGVKFWFELSTK